MDANTPTEPANENPVNEIATAGKAAEKQQAAKPPAAKPVKAEKATDDGRKGYTVAHGRTVTTDEGHKGPGHTALLTDEEAKRFRELGFILDEDGSRSVPIGGPAVNVTDGVQIIPA